jgi:hypothetical protein
VSYIHRTVLFDGVSLPILQKNTLLFFDFSTVIDLTFAFIIISLHGKNAFENGSFLSPIFTLHALKIQDHQH